MTRKTILAATLAPGLLAGCTGSDMSMGFDGSGPVPPAAIGGGGGTYGSPQLGQIGSGSALANSYGGLSAPTPPYPVEKLAGNNPQPVSNQQQTAFSAPAQPAASLPAAPSSSSSGIQSAPLLAPPTQPTTQTASYGSQSLSAPSQSTAPSQPALQPQPAAPAPAQTSAPVQQPVQTAARSQSSTEVQFLPLVGAPNEQANLLAQALSDEAARSQVSIRPASNGRAATRLKGYFSAFDDGNQSVLVYVWDVLDENDERIHRIQGQERFAKSAAGPWAGVDRAVLDRVARTTLQEAGSLSSTSG